MKICLAFSAGGHFTEMRRIMEAFEGHDIFFATIKAKSTENLPNAYFVRDTTGPTIIHMAFNMLIITIQSLRILLKEKPDVVVSTGADVTIPICYLAKLLGAKVIFIESVCRVMDLSPTGKIVYPVTDLLLVQWEKLAKKYNTAKYWGSVL